MRQANYILYLDDIVPPVMGRNVATQRFQLRQPMMPTLWVKSIEEFQEVVEKQGVPLWIDLDYDLRPEHYGGDYSQGGTGCDAASWLADICEKNNLLFPYCVIHSYHSDAWDMINKELSKFTELRYVS